MSDLPHRFQRISADERARILQLRKRGVSALVIARELQRSKYSVLKVIREAQGILYGAEPPKSAACPAFVERLLRVHPDAINGAYELSLRPRALTDHAAATASRFDRNIDWRGLKI